MNWREQLKGKSLYVVPLSHSDWAWTHTRQWHEERYALVFEDVLRLLRKHPEFRWYIEQENEQFAVFRERCPELHAELAEQVRAGRVGIGGATSAMRPSVYDPEVFIRNLVLGRHTFEELFPEADLSVYVNADTAGAHGQLPQLLTLAGYECYRWWRPLFPLDLKGIPRTFWWQGMDGSRVLATRGTYGGLCSPGQVLLGTDDDWAERADQFMKPLLDARLFDNEPSPYVWVTQGMDDGRPLRAHPNDEEIPLVEFMEEWNRRESIPLRFATPAEFYHAVKDSAELPVLTDVSDPVDVNFNPPWAGAAGLWRLRRQAEHELLRREKLELFARWLGIDADDPETCGLTVPPPTPLEIDWHEAAALSAHAMQWLFQGDFDAACDRGRALIHRTHTRCHVILRQVGRHVPATTPGGHALVWNLHPRPRRAFVPVHFCFVKDPPAQFKVLDSTGQELPYQRIHEYPYFKDRVAEVDVLVQADLPAGGYTLVSAVSGKPTPVPTPEGEFSNGKATLTFDRGLLVRYEMPEAGLTLAGDPGRPIHDLVFIRYDQNASLHVGPRLGEERFRPLQWAVEESGPLRWVHRAEGVIGRHPAVVRTILYRDEPHVEFRTEIECLGDGGLFVARFPMPADARLWGDIPFGVEPRDLSAEPYGGVDGVPEWMTVERRRPGQFYAQSWVDAVGEEQTVALISVDGDRWWLQEQERGTVGHILFVAADEFRHWEVNINQQARAIGRHDFRYALLPHLGDWQEAKIPERAKELRDPPLVLGRTRHGPGGELEPRGSLVEVTPDTVQLSALIPTADGCLARLVNLSADPVEARLRLPALIHAAVSVDFRDRPLSGPTCVVEKNMVTLTLEPWKIVTLKVT